MFGKIKIESISAIKDKKAEEITAEEITAINTELKASGCAGIEVSVAGELSSATSDSASKDAKIADLQAKITASEATAADLSSKLEAANNTISEQKALLGAPADSKTETEVENDKIKDKNQEVDADQALTKSILSQHGL